MNTQARKQQLAAACAVDYANKKAKQEVEEKEEHSMFIYISLH